MKNEHDFGIVDKDDFVWFQAAHYPSGQDWTIAANLCLPEEAKKAPSGNHKPKFNLFDHAKLVLFNCNEIIGHPHKCIAIQFGEGNYKVKNKFSNNLGVSASSLRKVCEILREQGFIHFEKGNYVRKPNAPGKSRCTRIKPTGKLKSLLRRTIRDGSEVEFNKNKPHIVQRNITKEKTTGGKTKRVKHEVLFDQTPQILAMEGVVQTYNNLIKNSNITVNGCTGNFLEWKDKNDKPKTMNIDPHRIHIARVFNRECWDVNGRFYGGFYQHIPKRFRKDILINGSTTVELDYSSIHISIIYGKLGLTPPKDPYYIDYPVLPYVQDCDEQRNYLKRLLLIAINAESPKSAKQAFRHSMMQENDKMRRIKDREIEEGLKALQANNPELKPYISTGAGAFLLNEDSKIAEDIIKHFTYKGIAVLSVHDSFIVENEHEEELRSVMKNVVKDKFRFVPDIK